METIVLQGTSRKQSDQCIQSTNIQNRCWKLPHPDCAVLIPLRQLRRGIPTTLLFLVCLWHNAARTLPTTKTKSTWHLLAGHFLKLLLVIFLQIQSGKLGKNYDPRYHCRVPCSWLGIHKCYLDPSWLNVSQRSSQQGVIAAQMFQHLCKTLDIWTAAYSLAVDQSSHSRSAFISGISGALTGSCSNGSFKGSLEVITQKNSMVPSLLTHPDNICIDTQLNCICM